MSRLHIATRGIGSWRERLANPARQWRRRFSAYETAVSWELSCRRPSGLPEPIEQLFRSGGFDEPVLLMGVAEHQVPLLRGNACSQCDVWGLIQTTTGMVSFAVEAKANESFGNKTLKQWLAAGSSAKSEANRRERWNFIRTHLPTAPPDAYLDVPYQLLHRCASAVIEARRFRLSQAAFIVQAFGSPSKRFAEFKCFCTALGISGEQPALAPVPVGEITLHIGWVDCAFATDEEVACTA